jgi:DNA-directed RNA polymerase specialized sigma24 family protein
MVQLSRICDAALKLLFAAVSMSTTSILANQQVLRRQLVDFSRRLFASFPWGYRIASVLTVLAADGLDAFGRTTYAEFIRAVVRGMPDTASGRPAFDLIQDVERRGPASLPPGYGKPFASRLYRILLTKFSEPDVAEEAMSQALLQIARGKVHVRNGVSLGEAESLVITIALNAARDIMRARGRRREDPLVREHDDEQATIDVEDPEAFTTLDKLLPASELKAVLRQLGQVHPRAPEWLQARLDGDSGQDIAADWGVTPSYVSKWQRIHLPEIKRVVEYHLRQAADPYSYMRRPITC